MPGEDAFKIPRDREPSSLMRFIGDFIPLEELELIGVTYAMGDGINKITDIRRVKNRGVLPGKAGEAKGTGTRVFDEIASSGLKAIVIPGLHRRLEVLDPRFRALYSHCASAEKVSLCYDAYVKTRAENLIVTDVSSNTVTIGIKDGKLLGAIDACLGAPGIFHGPLDLESLRRIDKGIITANKAFSNAGVIRITDHRNPRRILDPKEETDELAFNSLIMAVTMEVYSFLPIVKPEAVVVAGWAGISSRIFRELKNNLEEIAPVIRLDNYAAARGSAEIAKDILEGKRNFLGIEVEF